MHPTATRSPEITLALLQRYKEQGFLPPIYIRDYIDNPGIDPALLAPFRTTSRKRPIWFWSDEDVMADFWQNVPDHLHPDWCWRWTGDISTHNGEPEYGRYNPGNYIASRGVAAKYLRCDLTNIPVHHICGNKWCVNPRHLKISEERENNWTARNLEGKGIGTFAQNTDRQVYRARRLFLEAGGYKRGPSKDGIRGPQLASLSRCSYGALGKIIKNQYHKSKSAWWMYFGEAAPSYEEAKAMLVRS